MKTKLFKPNLPGIHIRKNASTASATSEEKMVEQNDALNKSVKEIDEEFFLGGEEPTKVVEKTKTHGKQKK